MEPTPTPDLPTTEELRAFVGSNADYYLAAWEPVLTGTGKAHATNKWVFFVPFFWLALRGMSGTAIILAVALAVIRFILGVFYVLEPDSVGPADLVGFVFALSLSVVCVVKGNAWYLLYAREEIADVRTKNLPEKEHLAAVAERGGLRVDQLVVYFVVALVLFVATEMTAESFGRMIIRR